MKNHEDMLASVRSTWRQKEKEQLFKGFKVETPRQHNVGKGPRNTRPKKSVRFAPESEKTESEKFDIENVLPADLNSEKFQIESPRTPLMNLPTTPRMIPITPATPTTPRIIPFTPTHNEPPLANTNDISQLLEKIKLKDIDFTKIDNAFEEEKSALEDIEMGQIN